jgi:hypothetical protein
LEKGKVTISITTLLILL